MKIKMAKSPEGQLAECFFSVFPELNHDFNLAKVASEDTLDNWNSLTAVELIIAVESIFNLEIPLNQYEKLVSFSGFLDVLHAGE